MNIRRYFFNRRKTSIYTTSFKFKSTEVNLLSCLIGLSGKQDGGFGVTIGQIACQSSSLWAVYVFDISKNSVTLNEELYVVNWMHYVYANYRFPCLQSGILNLIKNSNELFLSYQANFCLFFRSYNELYYQVCLHTHGII